MIKKSEFIIGLICFGEEKPKSKELVKEVVHDNCNRKLKDGQEYCSPSLNSKGKGIDN